MATQAVSDHYIFRLHCDRYRLERTGHERDFVRLDCPDWINVIPVTPEGEVVLIRQYRHGVRSVTLEIPGGMVDPGEDPETAAVRELEEETGYRAENVRLLGSVWPNPAIQNNNCYMYLAEGARCVTEPRPDPSELIEVVTYPLDDVPRLIAEGEIRHSLVVTAFGLLGVLSGPYDTRRGTR